jgi:DNA-binding CsgD family transcriptional regulator
MYLFALLCFFSARPEPWQLYHAALEKMTPQAPALLSVVGKTMSDPARMGVAALDEAAPLLSSLQHATDPVHIIRVGTAAGYLDRLGEVRDAAWRVVKLGRNGGPARPHLTSLFHLGLDDYLTGEWDEALQLAQEGLRLCGNFGYSAFAWYHHYIHALVSGARGAVDEAESEAQAILQWGLPRGIHCAAHKARHVLTVAAIGRGDFSAAYEHACAVSPAGSLDSHVPLALWVAMDLVESAVRTNRQAEAADHARAMREVGLAQLSPRYSMLTLAATALSTTDDDEALQSFVEALAVPGAERWAFERARIHLAYGERLRRVRATAESRGPLQAALETFRHLQAAPWVERAEKELRAAGWNKRVGGKPHSSSLTPQELEIAKLAASGLTNKQIGERLFLSHRTVSAHLYQMFPKLGITSRSMLRDVLEAPFEQADQR